MVLEVFKVNAVVQPRIARERHRDLHLSSPRSQRQPANRNEQPFPFDPATASAGILWAAIGAERDRVAACGHAPHSAAVSQTPCLCKVRSRCCTGDHPPPTPPLGPPVPRRTIYPEGVDGVMFVFGTTLLLTHCKVTSKRSESMLIESTHSLL